VSLKSRWFLAFIAAVIASLDMGRENEPLIRLALYGLLAFIFVLLTIDLALWLWRRFPEDRNDDKVPLMAAVRRAYSETEDSLYARHGRAIAGVGKGEGTPDELLLWYASGLSQHATFWGCEKSLDRSKPQDLENSHFVVQDGEIVAKKLFGDHPMSTGLMVSEKELAAFIQRVPKYPSLRI
jgi:hypothetical protein